MSTPLDAARETEVALARIEALQTGLAKRGQASRTEPHQERKLEPAQLELGL